MSAGADCGPAFPSRSWLGISKRDYLAAVAMQGLIAASGDTDGVARYLEEAVAQSAYAMADAMLKERSK